MKCEFRMFIAPDNYGGLVVATFRRTEELPFVPTPGMYFEFDEDDYYSDCYVVKELAWEAWGKTMRVMLDDYPCSPEWVDATIESLVTAGWDLVDDCRLHEEVKSLAVPQKHDRDS